MSQRGALDPGCVKRARCDMMTVNELLDWVANPKSDPADIPVAQLPLALALVDARLHAVQAKLDALDRLDSCRQQREARNE
jgi:hypothetical protein